jgi:hypothetical protein
MQITLHGISFVQLSEPPSLSSLPPGIEELLRLKPDKTCLFFFTVRIAEQHSRDIPDNVLVVLGMPKRGKPSRIRAEAS